MNVLSDALVIAKSLGQGALALVFIGIPAALINSARRAEFRKMLGRK